MDDEIIEGEVIDLGIDPEMDAQVRDFEWRLNGLGRTYQQALWWASEQPFRVDVEEPGSGKSIHVAKRFVRACGAALVTVGEGLIERAGLEDTEPEEQDLAGGGGFYTVPPIQFDFSKKE